MANSSIGETGNDSKSLFYQVRITSELLFAKKEQSTPNVRVIDLKGAVRGAANISFALFGNIENAATIAKLNNTKATANLSGEIKVVQ